MMSFESVIKDMKAHGMKTPAERFTVQVPEARNVLFAYMKAFIEHEGREYKWLPEYEQVSEWLSDSKGLGLMLCGNCGRGKSILCRYVLPAILLKYHNRVVSVYDIQDMNKNIDEVLKKPIISLDDIGTEEISVHFGEKRMAFAEIIDAAEKHNKLVIVSTNYNGSKLRELYGDRIIDRIKSITFSVLFSGDSLRTSRK